MQQQTQHTNLTLAMKHYGALSMEERELFLLMVTDKKPIPKKKIVKTISYVDYYKKRLTKNWNQRVVRRLEKYKNYIGESDNILDSIELENTIGIISNN